MNEYLSLKKIIEYQRKFVAERDWDQFHSPKNIAMGLSIETNELMEEFQWLSCDESYSVKQDPKKLAAIEQEVADVLFYLIRLADKLEINLEKAFWEKTEINEKKYPTDLAKGHAKKYREFLS